MDPLWVQAGATAVLVGITIYYAFQVRKSNENIWKLEEERIKKKKIGLRKLIISELIINETLWEEMVSEIEETSQSHTELKMVEIPEDTTYKSVVGTLGILGEEEMRLIMFTYRILKDIGKTYKKIVESQVMFIGGSSIDVRLVKKLKIDIDEVSRFYNTLDKLYQKLYKGEIEERDIEEEIKNVY